MTKRWLRKIVEEEAEHCKMSDLDFLAAFKDCCPEDRGLHNLIRELEKDFIREINKKEGLKMYDDLSSEQIEFPEPFMLREKPVENNEEMKGEKEYEYDNK